MVEFQPVGLATGAVVAVAVVVRDGYDIAGEERAGSGAYVRGGKGRVGGADGAGLSGLVARWMDGGTGMGGGRARV